MKIIKHILYAIAWVPLLLVNIPAWLFFFLPHKRKGTFESVKWDWNCWAWKWDVDNNSDFYKRLKKGSWWGFVIGNNIVFVDLKPGQDEIYEKHEEDHVLWNYILGPIFYPAYIIMSVFIWTFLHAKHAYLDNPLERSARKAAGQKVDLRPEEWPHGRHDRWPWKWPWE